LPKQLRLPRMVLVTYSLASKRMFLVRIHRAVHAVADEPEPEAVVALDCDAAFDAVVVDRVPRDAGRSPGRSRATVDVDSSVDVSRRWLALVNVSSEHRTRQRSDRHVPGSPHMQRLRRPRPSGIQPLSDGRQYPNDSVCCHRRPRHVPGRAKATEKPSVNALKKWENRSGACSHGAGSLSEAVSSPTGCRTAWGSLFSRGPGGRRPGCSSARRGDRTCRRVPSQDRP